MLYLYSMKQIRIQPADIEHYRFEVEVDYDKQPLIKIQCTSNEYIAELNPLKIKSPISVLFVGETETVEYVGKVSFLQVNQTNNFIKLTVRCDELKYLYGARVIRTDKINSLTND